MSGQLDQSDVIVEGLVGEQWMADDQLNFGGQLVWLLSALVVFAQLDENGRLVGDVRETVCSSDHPTFVEKSLDKNKLVLKTHNSAKIIHLLHHRRHVSYRPRT